MSQWVFSKGSMAKNGRASVNVQYGKENKGKLAFTLKKTIALSPFAQVVVYTVLPNRETVADSWNFPSEQCFSDKAFGMLPVQMLVDYSYQVWEYNDDPCIPGDRNPVDPPVVTMGRRLLFYYPYYSENDAYSAFKAIGVKIATNSDVKDPVYCHDLMVRPAIGQPLTVSVPYSVIRGEELTLKATVLNYLSKCFKVKVTLGSSNEFSVLPCKDCNYTRCVCAGETKTFEWIIKASVLGKVSVAVRADGVETHSCGMEGREEEVTGPERPHFDTVVQLFLVEADGVQQIITQNELICLTGNRVNTTVSLKLPEVVVKDSAKCFVTVLGDLISHALKNIADLLRMPYGCGEQNMLNFAPNIYILQYLESSGQLTPEILARAKTFLETGYQTQLKHKHYDGSYSAFGNSDSSGHTWLTAYVMKIFGGAKKYVFVDETNIDQAKNWLAQRQQKNGCFKTVGVLYHNEMKGGVSDDVTLTAYIVAALLELGMKTSDPMVKKGLVCLKEASSNVNNMYFTALASYTFTLAGDQEMRQKLISNLDNRVKREGDGRYWTQENNGQRTSSLEVEMSSYVLLALLSGPTLPSFKLDYSATIVRWLAKRQNAYGGFSSTQDTVVALQALAKYSAATYSPTGTVVVSVTSPSNQKYNFIVNQRNRLLYQERQLQPPTGNFTLATGGQGCVFVQFALHYSVLPSASTMAFSIITDATSTCNSRQYYTVTLALNVRYNGPREETYMVIINVKLLSGFVLDDLSLQDLQQDSRIKLVEQNEGHVILYLDRMKKKEGKTFTLVLLQTVVVKNLKPAVVKVYDYYKTGEGAVKQYTSPCVK
ncbi:putative alpha-2-macroglobulin-like protein 1 [Triplophysa rosa]|uniref:Alpha-2-macroglobulin-like protein 1 n=1 Tax=Triplophysa rosa TaxID=992332 RepID=A0A9W7WIR3_TRIRA|nr:putative alpha-2-macroglobulin-like protein 1 [Triplophysa rosa]